MPTRNGVKLKMGSSRGDGTVRPCHDTYRGTAIPYIRFRVELIAGSPCLDGDPLSLRSFTNRWQGRTGKIVRSRQTAVP